MSISWKQKMANRLIDPLNNLRPIWLLFVRVWIGYAFLRSGLTKINDFDTTIFLFANEYKVPLIPAEFAAYSATFFELFCPVLLTLGFATRLATLPLIVMTAVIQFTYLDHVQHYYWAIILFGILIFGPGRLSLDHKVRNKYAKRTPEFA